MGAERGAISAFVAVIAVAMVLVAGLVLDGGRLLSARRLADDIAANAARAGAQALDEGGLRAGHAAIDPVAGQEAVATYLATTPAAGTARVAGDAVDVTVRIEVRMLLLGIAGIPHRTVAATRRARAVRGVTAGGS